MKTAASILALTIACAMPALAFEPEKPVEFVVTAGAGGGTDIFARTIQAIIGKYDLMSAPVIVTNKGGASGAEGFVYAATAPGDAYKLTFGTNNAYLLPLRAKVPYKESDLTPVASMAADEFILWVAADDPAASAADFITEAKANPGLKVGGSQSKDVDQILTVMINQATGANLGYIPFKSGGEAGTQLSGKHVAANVNNPSENAGQWEGSMVKPLCVFRPDRLAGGAKVAGDKGWSDIPTCAESGIAIDSYNMPRTVWLPAGVDQDVVDYYAAVLKKVSETPEWAKYLADSSQSAAFKTGPELTEAIAADESAVKGVLEKEGWLVN